MLLPLMDGKSSDLITMNSAQTSYSIIIDIIKSNVQLFEKELDDVSRYAESIKIDFNNETQTPFADSLPEEITPNTEDKIIRAIEEIDES